VQDIPRAKRQKTEKNDEPVEVISVTEYLKQKDEMAEDSQLPMERTRRKLEFETPQKQRYPCRTDGTSLRKNTVVKIKSK
jgi:hypothetical protein